MTKIFISHSSTDTSFARQIAQALTEVGVNIWLDVSDIRLGQNWSTEVQRGLDACDVMILIVTPESMASENVENEWQYYLDEKKPVFTILWRPAKLHFQLRRLQYIDFHEQEFRLKFGQMIARLRQQQIITTSTAQGQMHEIGADEKSTPTPSSQIKDVKQTPHLQEKPQMGYVELKGASPIFVATKVEDILPPPFEWCKVPAGKVTLEKGGYVPEGGQTFDVPAFAIAKYPITNAQFEIFVSASDGYIDEKWWDYSEEAKESREENSHPQETAFVGDNLPRTNVSWYEAVAFCRWLSTRIAPLDYTSITLPTEQKWQRAAQGDDGRIYPWGNQFDQNKANTSESNLDTTTPVTKYPQGASPYGVLDMSGNVWEWCLTDFETGSQGADGINRRGLRGGSWNNNQVSVRASYRLRNFPLSWFSNLGFRVCLSSPNSS